MSANYYDLKCKISVSWSNIQRPTFAFLPPLLLFSVQALDWEGPGSFSVLLIKQKEVNKQTKKGANADFQNFFFIAKYDCPTCVAVFLQLQIHLLVLFFGIVLDIPIGFSKRAICQCKCLQVPLSRRCFTTPPHQG